MAQPDISTGAHPADDKNSPPDTSLFDNTETGRIAALVAQRFSHEGFGAPTADRPFNTTPFNPDAANPLDSIHIGAPAQSPAQTTERPTGDRQPAKQNDASTPNLADLSAKHEVNVDAQRAAMLANFAQYADQKHQKYATEWMNKAEQKVAHGELSAQELGRTYEQVNRLLTTDSPYLTKEQRTTVGAEILYHMSTPRIDQGLHGTCNVTVLENIGFDKNPSMAAKIVADAALTGTFTGADGRKINLPPDSLQPGFEEQDFFPPEDVFRTHASQLFQVAVLNDVGRRDTSDPRQFIQKHEGVGSIFFKVGQELLPFSEYWMPTGYEVWRHKGGKETDFDGLTTKNIDEESRRLFGDKYPVLNYKSPYERWSHPFAELDEPGKSKMIDSDNTLRQTLGQLKAGDHLPSIVAVNGLNTNIMRDAGALDMILSAVFRPVKTLHNYIDTKLGIVNHVVTIKQYDPTRDRVYISNSWGNDNDGWLSVSDLWDSM